MHGITKKRINTQGLINSWLMRRKSIRIVGWLVKENILG